jgi:hypothetical protein
MTQALQMQMEVQKKLHEQLEVYDVSTPFLMVVIAEQLAVSFLMVFGGSITLDCHPPF